MCLRILEMEASQVNERRCKPILGGESSASRAQSGTMPAAEALYADDDERPGSGEHDDRVVSPAALV
jgi:hypothetical protein